MVSFDIKLEKANAILRYRRLQRITTLFRFMEICFFLVMISRFTPQLPVSFKLSGEYFRGLSLALISPRFVFVVGNAIILVLFLKSGQFSAHENTNVSSRIDFQDDYVETCEKIQSIFHKDEIKKQGKHSTPEEIKKQSMLEESRAMSDTCGGHGMNFRRSHSENFKREEHEASGRKLRRSSTGTYRKSVNCGQNSPVNSYSENEMSSEEFRLTVEAFIARQQKTLREEEFSAVVSSGA